MTKKAASFTVIGHGRAVLPLFLIAFSLALIAAPIHAASLSISGTVKDSDGKPLAGANVYAVADTALKTTSAADGSFTLAGTIIDPATQPEGSAKPAANAPTPIAAARDGYMPAQVLAPNLSAKGLQFTLYPSIIGATVTLKGNRLSNVHLRENAQWDKTRFVFLIAFDGPPGIKAEADQIWADYHPGDSIDADAARELENQFKSRLMYYVGGPLAEGMWKAENYGGGHLMSITGTIHEADGKKWITATDAKSDYRGPIFPSRLTAGPEKPLIPLPTKPGLALKLTDTLSDTLIYVPPGKFYMGNALEQVPHWQEAPQHLVTFAKGFYLSDHPILNSEYAAVTGDATRNPKNHPDAAAANMSREMFDVYVKALEKLNPGKVIRAPSRSEWEYVARSGTSNLEFNNNPKNRCGQACDRNTAVKSTKPNGWGFYGICFSDGTERSCDEGFFGDHAYLPPSTDPRYASPKFLANPTLDHIFANGGDANFPINELFNDDSNVGAELGGIQRNGPNWKLIRQRILVEE